MGRPWKGDGFGQDEHRVLLLGESQYSWYEDDEVKHPSEDHAVKLVEWAVGKLEPRPRLMATLSRALTRKETPGDEERRAAWSRVAFVNHVDGTVGAGPGVRPTQEMWDRAKAGFRDLLEDLKPRTVIVMGKEMWKHHIPEADLHLTDDVQGYRLTNGEIAMCWAISHPSRGVSWRRISKLIAFATERKVLNLD